MANGLHSLALQHAHWFRHNLYCCPTAERVISARPTSAKLRQMIGNNYKFEVTIIIIQMVDYIVMSSCQVNVLHCRIFI